MKILVDEDVDIRVIDFLSKLGHDAKRVPSGLKNGDVIRLAAQESRALITQDSDFLDNKRYPPERYAGILCIRIHPPLLEKLTQALNSYFANLKEDDLRGKTLTLREEGVSQS